MNVTEFIRMCAHISPISEREGRKLTATTIDTGYAWTT